MKPKRIFRRTAKVRRDQADRMLVKLRKKGHSKAEATAALVLHIWDVIKYRRPSRFDRIRNLFTA